MSGVHGVWDLVIATPIGRLPVILTLTEGGGTAESRGETVQLEDMTVDDGRVTWRQSVTKPMRLNLGFEVTVDGDVMTGFAKAGRLPRSAVSGRRADLTRNLQNP